MVNQHNIETRFRDWVFLETSEPPPKNESTLLLPELGMAERENQFTTNKSSFLSYSKIQTSMFLRETNNFRRFNDCGVIASALTAFQHYEFLFLAHIF